MQLHLGRLIDHVHLVVSDFERSKSFYRAVLGALGREVTFEFEGAFACDELFISDAAFTRGANTAPHHVHLAFQTPDRATVDRFHQAGLAAGGRDNGAPGERPHYHPGYYAAFLLDPDGNNLEAVHHGPARRSAPSVVIDADL